MRKERNSARESKIRLWFHFEAVLATKATQLGTAPQHASLVSANPIIKSIRNLLMPIIGSPVDDAGARDLWLMSRGSDESSQLGLSGISLYIPEIALDRLRYQSNLAS